VFPLISSTPFNDDDLPIPTLLKVLYTGTGLFGKLGIDEVVGQGPPTYGKLEISRLGNIGPLPIKLDNL